jgi:glyoxylase-like metal-dependent hydrolase (beta-lactamase superfamily II)
MNIVNVGYDSTNYYVLATKRAKLLIDIGWPGTLPKLRHQLSVKGLGLHELTHLLVTHYHPDHAGLTQDVRELGLQLIVLEQQQASIPRLRSYMKPSHSFRDVTLHDARVISADHSRSALAQLGIAGEIVHTPGHSDDSVSLVLDTGVAFTGDLAPPSIVDDDARQIVAESWNRIRARGVRQIYPGHGPVWPLEPPPNADHRNR